MILALFQRVRCALGNAITTALISAFASGVGCSFGATCRTGGDGDGDTVGLGGAVAVAVGLGSAEAEGVGTTGEGGFAFGLQPNCNVATATTNKTNRFTLLRDGRGDDTETEREHADDNECQPHLVA